MEYLVPAWHKQLIDWSFTVPTIEFDDAISHCRVLQKGGHQVGILLTDYLPYIYTQLNSLALNPDKIFSVFDYLQGVNVIDNQSIDYRDLKWPEGIHFDMTNFRLFAVLNNEAYACVHFDIQGKILNIEYLQGPHQGENFLFDSRGFVSRIQKGQEETYLDLSGHWRLKCNQQTGQVKINPNVKRFCKKSQYDNMTELIQEVVVDQFLKKLQPQDHLIVTADDDSKVPLKVYNPYQPIFSFSRWHPAENHLESLRPQQVIVNNDQEGQRLKGKIPDNVAINTIPLFQSQFKLGHSQRLSQQRIGIFAEHLSAKELNEMLEMVYPRLLKDPDDTGLYLFSYTQEKDGMVHQVFQQFREHHKGEFILSRDEIDPGENQLEEFLPPLLTIKLQRLISNEDVLTSLDKIRLLINWNQADEFLSIAAVSVGIPMLQNFQTAELQDHQNGLICHDLAELKAGISYYLDVLKHWNESLVYNVQILNRYSEENLLAKWEQILGKETTR